MSRLDVANIASAIALVIGVAVSTGAQAQEAARVFPWPTMEKKSLNRESGVRKATLVEALDYKRRQLEQPKVDPLVEPAVKSASAVREAILVDHEEPTAPGAGPVDPTLPPVPPPATPATPPAKEPIAPKPAPPQPHVVPVPRATSIPVVIEGPGSGPLVMPTPPVMPMPNPSLVPLPFPPGAVPGPTHMMGPEIAHDGGEMTVEGNTTGCETSTLLSLSDMLPGGYVDFGVVWLARQTRRNQTLTGTRFDGDSFHERNSRDFDSDAAPGVRATFGMMVDWGWYVESSFLGLMDWERTRRLTGQITSSRTTFPLVPGSSFTEHVGTLESSFYSGEVNMKWAYSVYPMSYFIFGTRFLDIRDELTLIESGTGPVQGGVIGNMVGRTEIETCNRIFGPQVGFESRWYNFTGRLSLESFLKAGFGWDTDDVRIRRTLSNSPGGPLGFGVRDRETDVVGFVEFESAVGYRFHPQIAIRGGYHFLGVFGYASALLQRPNAFLDGDQHFEVDSSETVFFHGLFASLEFTWGGAP
jgi:hypothetical protein